MPDLSLRTTRIGLSAAFLAILLAEPSVAAVGVGAHGTEPWDGLRVLHQAQVVAPSIPQTRLPRESRDVSVDDDAPTVRAAEEVHETRLADVVEIISDASRGCRNVTDDYTVDCIAKHLRAAAATLPKDKAFDEAQRTLTTAAVKLERLVRQNADLNQPKVTVKLESPTRTRTPPLQASTPSVRDEVRAQALQVLEEATTVLLRSAEATQGRATHFQRIADALNSNKVLLRS